MLEIRVADGSLLRLIGKCLHVGVLDGVELSTSDTGATQGSVLSPLHGNIICTTCSTSGSKKGEVAVARTVGPDSLLR